MTNSLSTLREFYPQLISWKISDFKKVSMNDASVNQKDFEQSIYYELRRREKEGGSKQWQGAYST